MLRPWPETRHLHRAVRLLQGRPVLCKRRPNFSVRLATGYCPDARPPQGSPRIFAKEGRKIMMINRRAFSAAMIAGATASLLATRGIAAVPAPTKARHVVLVHGLFADGSRW